MLSQSFTPLLIVLPMLMADAAIEMGFLVTMVRFLHARAGKWFDVSYPAGSVFELPGKPKGLLVNQGHTSNGAAGTALILVGIGGLLVLWLQRRRSRNTSDTRPSGLFTFWVVMTVLSNLLTLAALIYTFILTSQTDNQTINLSVAAANAGSLIYPLDNWTPENWFAAILNQVPLAHDSDRHDISQQLKLMRGWRWNLIPLFALGFITVCFAVWEWLRLRRARPVSAASAKEGAY